jgi:Holliday junction resolvasome RuvABC ATP-dependent DNA helicase subunit
MPYLIELQSMIGMQSVKDSIFYQTIYYLQNMHSRNTDGDYLHTIITGKPGTGKTTVAKIIGKIYQNIGILSRNSKFKIAHREDMVGEYLGSTANKTKKLLTSCLGGVLFVDEVYALGPGQKDKDSYSKEAIDTICAFLSENKNNFCFIAAGYKDEIEKCFFSVNEGLRRRFQWVHNIDDYQPKDLSLIFLKMVGEMNWETKIQTKEITEIITKNIDLFKDAGGSMENLFSKIKLVHSKRVFGLAMDQKFIITINDITGAIEMMKNNDMAKNNKKERFDYYT